MNISTHPQMNLTNSELDTLYALVENKHYKLMHDSAFGDWEAVKEEVCELHLIRYKLLKLQEKPAFKVEQKKLSFETPTAIASKLLHIKEGDLRALRKCGELERGYHYETGRNPKPSAIFYNLETSCIQLHGVTWKEFSKPGFDVEANRERQVEKAFARAREGAKK